MFETAKPATFGRPFGTVAGDQFSAVFQSPVAGSNCHVALPARAVARGKARARQAEQSARASGMKRRVLMDAVIGSTAVQSQEATCRQRSGIRGGISLGVTG